MGAVIDGVLSAGGHPKAIIATDMAAMEDVYSEVLRGLVHLVIIID